MFNKTNTRISKFRSLLIVCTIAAMSFAGATKISAYKRLTGELDDTGRVTRAAKAAETSGILEFDVKGDFKISTPINVSKIFVIKGIGKRLVNIEQQTANEPVFVSYSQLPFERHSYQWSNMTLSNKNTPSTLTPKQYGIMFKAGIDGDFRDSNGVYYSHFSDIRLHNQYIGMGNWTTSVGTHAFWGNYIDRCEATSIAHSGFWFGNGGAIGQPYNRFRNVAINGVGVTQTANATAFYGIGLGMLVVDSLGIEDWTGKLFLLQGGGLYDIANVNTERVFYNENMRLFDLADGHFNIRNIFIEGNSSSIHSIISLYGASTTGNISGIFTHSTTWKKIHLEAGAKAQLSDVDKAELVPIPPLGTTNFVFAG